MKSLILKLLKRISPTLFFRNTPTIHYAFSFLLLIAVAVGIANVAATERTRIVLESNSALVSAGDEFEIRVYAVATTPVNAVSLTITVPSDAVEVLGVDRGESVITLWTEDPKIEDNRVFLQGGTYRRGFIGKHLIATLNVKAKQAGQATFLTSEASLLAGDGRGSVVPTDLSKARTELAIRRPEDATVAVTGEAAVVIVTDIDGDGSVTLSDISSFMAEWVRQNNRYDFNNDGVMTIRDFSIILASYFKGTQ